MSYRINIDPRSSKAGRFIRRVHGEIQRLFSESGMTQQELANKLGVNRATVNKRLLGEENMTMRSIADMAWAMDADISFQLRAHGENTVGNQEPRLAGATTKSNQPTFSIGIPATTTIPSPSVTVVHG